jgi:putative ABC transport system permease protein
LSQITLSVGDLNEVDNTAAIVTHLLEQNHDTPDYAVVVPKELLQQAKMMQMMFNILLVVIAGISLLVGGIGIMNIMLATVTERTREIGVRRAIGATQGDIVQQFLIETVVLSATGGLLGVACGFLCGPAIDGVRRVLMEFFPKMMAAVPPNLRDLEPRIAMWSIFVAFGISVGVGVVFGLYPARRAAMMDPIEALRHE